MQKLVEGIHHFQSNTFASEREFFERMAHGQTPETLFITCSDSRINPNLLTNTGPGDLFILRNAGNIVPAWGAANGGESATIEYAVVALGVRDIIICGHSHCGAMMGLLGQVSLANLPALGEWLGHADATLRIIRENYSHLQDEALLVATVQENVLAQLKNLKTHPCVASRVGSGELHLHGWVYKIETGEVFTYDNTVEQFTPVEVETAQVAKRPQPGAAGVAPI